ncbi:LAMI_0E02960g1_1 [Lachancea mirantina]|uniref:LAMI_0E02960g1_1 n=1 Tax=Lachancea mirantina TaxID=1230905 RepID=A0A1G4JJL3_9SACH|nr:LAMI_0E02960g1_1 [Lachancea mirantina]
MGAPEIIRVKRKRNGDSVHALFLEDDHKAKRGRYVFKLAKTVERESLGNDKDGFSPLLKTTNDGSNRHFVLEQEKRKLESEELPIPISEMLDDYLTLHKDSKANRLPKRKRLHNGKNAGSLETSEPTTLDYVYDIYYREYISEDEYVFDEKTVGYIRIVEESGSVIPEEADVDESGLLSDDQDSNEETFYQNDYPEDEDDDRSIDFGDSDGSREVPAEVEEGESDHFETLFEQFDGHSDILDFVNARDELHDQHNYDEGDYGESDNFENSDIVASGFNTASFRRNMFFPGDIDDPLAIHRDRIFNKLETMIKKG